MSDIRVCANDGEPLVFTFEFPGAEYVCVVCGRTEDVFGQRATAMPELLHRLDDVTEQYERGRAERTGQTYVAPERAGVDGAPMPACSGCGATVDAGMALVNGKPRGWFSRQRDGVTVFACSSTCIPDGEGRVPW